MQLVDWLCGVKHGISSIRKTLSTKKRATRTAAFDIEKLEERTVLTYTAVLAAGALVLSDSIGDGESLQLSAVEKDGDGIFYLAHGIADNNGLSATDQYDFGTGSPISIATLTSITVDAGEGDDTLVIDFSTGNLIPTGVTLTFNGGPAGSDQLISQGGTFTAGQVDATGQGAGTIQYDALGLITFNGLEPVTDDNAVANFTINANANQADTITIANAAGNRTIVSEAANNFESVAFKNKTNVTVNARGNTDTVTLANNSAPATGLANLAVNTGADAGDLITINNALTFPTGTLTLTAPAITQTAGAVTLTTLNLNGPTDQTGGSLAVTGITTITAGTGDTGLGQATNDFGTVNVVSGKNVTIAEANAIILGPIAATGDLNVVAVGAITQNGAVTGIAKLNYDSGATIGINAAITTTSTVAINSTGVTTIAAAGDINAGGAVTFGATKAGTLTTSGDITTVNALSHITFTRAVNVAEDITLAGTGDVTFTSTVNTAAAAITGKALTVNATGNTRFDDQVGATRALSALTIGGVSTFNVTAAATVTTTGNQTYTGNVTLLKNTSLASTDAASNITFGGTIDSDGIAPAKTLTITAGTTGTIEFKDDVGTTTAQSAVGTLLATAANIKLNGGAVNTTGSQTYNGNATLGANATLTSTDAASNITFGGTVDSDGIAPAKTLTITAGTAGSIEFKKDVGKATAQSAVGTTVATAAAIKLNGGAINTTGSQTYNGDATLGANATLTSTDAASNITFDGTVDSDGIAPAKTLTITAGTAGTIEFKDDVGIATAQSAVGATAATAANIKLNGGAVTSTDSQDYNGSVTLGANATLTTTAATGDITFNGTVNSDLPANAFSLTLSAGDTITFKDEVGNSAPLGSAADAAITITRGTTVTFDPTVAEVKLKGALRVQAANATVQGPANKAKISGQRVTQNVVEILASNVTLQNLEIADTTDDTGADVRKNGSGVVVKDTINDTTLTGVKLINLNVHGNPASGIVLDKVTGAEVTKSNIHDNDVNGIYLVAGSGNTIGHATDGTQINEIHNNDASGIAIASNAANINNRIQLNSIYDNTKLGIDLNDNSRTTNDKAVGSIDTDTGANNLQNTPEILYAFKYQDPVTSAYSLNILYHVPSPLTAPDAFDVDFYVADTGNQEGKTLVRSTKYTDTGLHAVLVSFDLTLAQYNSYVQGTTIFVATATDKLGNTSEFSLPAALNTTPDAIIERVDAVSVTQIDPNPAIKDVALGGQIITPLTRVADVVANPDVRSERKDFLVGAAPADTTTTWNVSDIQTDTTVFDHTAGLYELKDIAGTLTTAGSVDVAPSFNSLYAGLANTAKLPGGSLVTFDYADTPTYLLGVSLMRTDPNNIDANVANAILPNRAVRGADGLIDFVVAPQLTYFSFPEANPDKDLALIDRVESYSEADGPVLKPAGTATPFANMASGDVFNHLGKIYLRVEDGALILPWEDNAKSSTDNVRVDAANNRIAIANVHLPDYHLVFGDFNDAVFTISNADLKPVGGRATSALSISFPTFTPEDSPNLPLVAAALAAPTQAPQTAENQSTTNSESGDSTVIGPVAATTGGTDGENGTPTINGTADSGSADSPSNSTSAETDTNGAKNKKGHKQPKPPKTKHNKDGTDKVSKRNVKN